MQSDNPPPHPEKPVDPIEKVPHQSNKENLTLIFVHGWLCDKRIWRSVIQSINRPVRAINFELGGFGESVDLLLKQQQLLSPNQQSRKLEEILREYFQVDREHPLLFVSHGRLGAAVVQSFLHDYSGKYQCRGWITCSSAPSLSAMNHVVSFCKCGWLELWLQSISAPLLGDLVMSLMPEWVVWFAVKMVIALLACNTKAANLLVSWLELATHQFSINQVLLRQLRCIYWIDDSSPGSSGCVGDGSIANLLIQCGNRLHIIQGGNDWLKPPLSYLDLFIKQEKGEEDEWKDVKVHQLGDCGHFSPLTHAEDVVECIHHCIDSIIPPPLQRKPTRQEYEFI